MKKGEQVHVEEKWACEWCRGVAGHSTAPRESHIMGTWESGWRGRARRRCMKAKALQTIVTLYMTSSCYNNTAVIYCTVQVRLNIWLDKADHSLQHQFCPDSVCVCFFFLVFFPTIRHLCFCSSTVHGSAYIHILNTTWKKKTTKKTIQVIILVRSIYTVYTNPAISCLCFFFFIPPKHSEYSL